MNNINIWSEMAETLRSLVGGLLSNTEQFVTQGLPRVILAGVTLVVGWLLAVFIRKLVARGLRGFGFDVIMERTGIRPYLVQRGVSLPPSALVAWGLYIVVLYSALVLALQRLEFETGAHLLITVAVWLPQVLVAFLLVALGNTIGRWTGRVAERAARVADIPLTPLIGVGVHAAVLLFAAMLAVRHLGLASDQLLLVGLALFLGAVLVLALIVAFCARDELVNLLAAQAIRASYQVGDRIRIADWSGKIAKVGRYTVTLDHDEGLVNIPASRFMNEVVTRLK